MRRGLRWASSRRSWPGDLEDDPEGVGWSVRDRRAAACPRAARGPLFAMADGSPGASSVHYVATCGLGTEPALAGELQRMGMREVQASHGSVAFAGGEDDGMRVCL